MRDIEGIEEAAAILRPHQSEIDADFQRINNRFLALFNVNHEPIGRVLRAHLVIENFMTTFLQEHFGLAAVDEARLSFFQKATLLPIDNSPAAIVRPGILQINAVRNKFGHRLEHEITVDEISSVYSILAIARSHTDFADRVDAIEAFAPVACAWLSVSPRPLQELFSRALAHVRIKPAVG